jgi:hypothetical protein
MDNLQSIDDYRVSPPPGFSMHLDLDGNLFPRHIITPAPRGYSTTASAICEWTCGFEGTSNMEACIPDPIQIDQEGNFVFKVYAPFCAAHEKDDYNERRMRRMWEAHQQQQLNIMAQINDQVVVVPMQEEANEAGNEPVNQANVVNPHQVELEVEVVPEPMQLEASASNNNRVQLPLQGEVSAGPTGTNTRFQMIGGLIDIISGIYIIMFIPIFYFLFIL